MIVNVHEAKTQLSQLLKRVALGDTVVIARDGVPVAKLTPITSEVAQRVPELAKGLWSYTDEWDSAETNALVAEMFLGENASESVVQLHEDAPVYTLKKRVAKQRPSTKRKAK